MISRDTTPAGTAGSSLRRTRAALLLTTGLVGAAAAFAPAYAAVTNTVAAGTQTVTISGAESTAVINPITDPPSAEIYSSLAAIDQNQVFGQSLDILTERRSSGASQAAALMGGGEGGVGARLWFNPVAVFARYGTNPLGAAGQSAIRANTYGGSLGLDIAYSDTGADYRISTWPI